MIDALLPPIAAPLPAAQGAPAPAANGGREGFSQALDAAQRRPDDTPEAAAGDAKPPQARSDGTRTPGTGDEADPAAPAEGEQRRSDDGAAPQPVDLAALLPGWPPAPPLDAAAPSDAAACGDAAFDALATGATPAAASAAGATPRAAAPGPNPVDLHADGATPAAQEPSTHDQMLRAEPQAGIAAGIAADPGAARATADLAATAPRPGEHAALLTMPGASAGTIPSGAAGTPAAAFQAHLAAAVDSPAFAPSLGATLSLLARDGVQQAQLNLHPAELGPVAVQIAVDGTQARVDFHAANAATRAALEAALPDLAAALRDSGLTLAGGGVFDRSPRRQAEPAQGARREATDRDEPLVRHAPAPLRPRGVVDLYA